MTRTAKIILIVAAIAVVIAVINNVMRKYTGDIAEVVNTITQEHLQNSHPERNIKGSRGSADTMIDYVDIEWIMGEVEVQYGDVEQVCWEETYIKGSPNEDNVLCYSVEDNRLNLAFCADSDGSRKKNNCVKQLQVTLPRDTEYRKIKVENINGNIAISSHSTEILAETVNGNATVHTFAHAQKVSMESVNGALSLYLPDTASFVAEVDKLNGSVNIDFPNTKHHNEYTVGTAPYIEVDMETINGKISILPE